jgi:thiol peroxidase
MTQILFKGKPIHTSGSLPALHKKVPDFRIVDSDLKDCSLKTFVGKRKLIATVPSIDTSVCSAMTKKLNEGAKKKPSALILVVSADLPFAQKHYCEREEVNNVQIFSTMRDKAFGKDYGLAIQDGPLEGLLARSLMVLNEKDELIYMELVPEITNEPDYEKAFTQL